MSRSITATRGDLESIAHAIAAASTIAVIGHIRPDADAIGSVTGLVRGARSLGKKVTGYIGQESRFSENLYTIPGADRVVLATRFVDEPDLVVTVDCGDLPRTGRLAPYIQENRDKVAVIDHHDTNPGFGRWNYISPESESTSVIVTELLDILGVELTKDIAHSLYAGLVTDTSNFRWGRPQMHRLAARFLEFGLDPRTISGQLIDDVSATDVQLIGNVLKTIDVLQVDRMSLAVLTVPHELTIGRSKTAVEKVVDYANSIRGADVGVVLKGIAADRWSVSFRSATYNVSALAALLGGGGHAKAAAAVREGQATAVLEDIVSAVHAWQESNQAF